MAHQSADKDKKPNEKKIHFALWEKTFDRVLTPFEEFIHRQTTSGMLLMAYNLYMTSRKNVEPLAAPAAASAA